MAFPKVLYVRRANEVPGREFVISTNHERLVQIDPVEIAAYELVGTKRYKRIIVVDRQDRAKLSKVVPRKGKPGRWEEPF